MMHMMITNTNRSKLLPATAGLLTLALWALWAASSLAQILDEQSAVEAGRDALTERADFPWYDEDTDSIRRIDVRVTADNAAHRDSTWQMGPRKPNTGTARPMRQSSFLRGLVQTLLWGGLLGLLALVVALLVRAFVNADPFPEGDSGQVGPDGARSEEDLIENLPFDVGRPQTNLLGEARRHYERGTYGEAIIYLFSYQLVRLDQQHLIRLTRGKTNRQYLAEIVSRPRLHAMLARTMVAFEDVFFGEHTLDRERFEGCWRRLDEFHRRLEEVAH